MTLIFRAVVVLDTKDLESESLFWATITGGVVIKDEKFHTLIDSSGEWTMGFQYNPNHISPEWPNGKQQQQIHLDLHTESPHELNQLIIASGGHLLQSADSLDSPDGFQVYADPACHPFCMGWGHPSKDEVRSIYLDFRSQSENH